MEYLCTSCQTKKPLSEYYLVKHTGLPRTVCKKCHKERYYSKRRIVLDDPSHREITNARRREKRALANPKAPKLTKSEIQARNREYNRAYGSRPENIAKRRERVKRYALDPMFRMHRNVATCISKCLKQTANPKNGRKWETLVGYSLSELRIHLEHRFIDGMNWGNYGLWHVDHVTPKSSFDMNDPIQFAKCWSLENLQPLWATDNFRKGNR